MIALVFAFAAATAQPLWKDLSVGMTADQVRVLYPTGKTLLTPECEAKVLTRYTDGKLTSVYLRFGDLFAAGRRSWDAALKCQQIVADSMTAKYGNPYRKAFEGKPGARLGKDVYFFENGAVLTTLTIERGRPFTVVSYEWTKSLKELNPQAVPNL